MNFFAKLNDSIEQSNSLLVLGLDPNPEMMPPTYLELGLLKGLEYWLKETIAATVNDICAYKPTLGFYQALGAKGLALLDRILAEIPSEIPVILDAKHGDLNSSTVFARAIFEDWQVDAVTLTPYLGQDQVAPFLVYPDKGVFILTHTSNPGAISLQEYSNSDRPFYLQVIETARTWGTIEQVSLEVGTIEAEVIEKIRKIAPERTILVRSLWERPESLEPILRAGLRSNGKGLLIPVPQDFLSSLEIIDKLSFLNKEINRVRREAQLPEDNVATWQPDVELVNQHPYRDLILQLFDIGCLMFGEYVQASGATFSYYIDLRKIISNPQVFGLVLDAYANILKNLEFDRIAGIPYGSLPTATGLAIQLHRPMIYPRKEVKAHGTRRTIEGNYQAGDQVVVVDDILISGKSAIEAVEKLTSAGLIVKDLVVLIDHEKGVKKRIEAQGYRAYSVIGISDITEILYEANRINEGQYRSLQDE
jgi:uridine monophosphate synthetase